MNIITQFSNIELYDAKWYFDQYISSLKFSSKKTIEIYATKSIYILNIYIIY